MEDNEYANQCVKFVDHVKAHKEVQDAPTNPGEVMCKICNKTFDEIVKGKDWNFLDELKKMGVDYPIIIGAFNKLIEKVKEDSKDVPQEYDKTKFDGDTIPYIMRIMFQRGIDFTLKKIDNRAGDLDG